MSGIISYMEKMYPKKKHENFKVMKMNEQKLTDDGVNVAPSSSTANNGTLSEPKIDIHIKSNWVWSKIILSIILLVIVHMLLTSPFFYKLCSEKFSWLDMDPIIVSGMSYKTTAFSSAIFLFFVAVILNIFNNVSDF